jgi:transposase
MGHCPSERQLSPAQYHRFAKRLGKAKAVTAVSHSVLVIIYHVLRDQKPYQDLGADYFEHLDTRRLANQSVKRLEALGFQVTLQPQKEVLA